MNFKNYPQQYIRIINRFLKVMGEQQLCLPKDAELYIENLRLTENLSKENQRLHIAALKYFYRHTLGQKLNIKAPYRNRPIPTTMTFDEVQILLKELPERYLLLFQLMYGLGLKIGEVLRLRIKNIDINNGHIFLSKSREIKIPHFLFQSMHEQLKKRQKQYIKDKKEQHCFIKKQNARLSTDFEEQPFFASRKRTKLKSSTYIGRQFIDPSTLHVYTQKAQSLSSLNKRSTTMTLRHSFALHQLKRECNEVELSNYLGHTDIRQTLYYKKLLQRTFSSPYDLLIHPERKDIVKELNYLQNYPCKESLKDLLIQAQNQNITFLAQTDSSDTWNKWLNKAQQKQLNHIESCDEYENRSADFIFLDLNKIKQYRPLKQIRTINSLLALSRKKLIIHTIRAKQKLYTT